MPKIIIDVVSKDETYKEEIINDLLWYDPVDKYLHKWKGGQLKYEYVDFPGLLVHVKNMGWIPGKTIAYPSPLFKNAYKKTDNKKDILNWFNTNKDEMGLNIIDAGERQVIIGFDDNTDKVDSSLYYKRFRYEIIDD